MPPTDEATGLAPSSARRSGRKPKPKSALPPVENGAQSAEPSKLGSSAESGSGVAGGITGLAGLLSNDSLSDAIKIEVLKNEHALNLAKIDRETE